MGGALYEINQSKLLWQPSQGSSWVMSFHRCLAKECNGKVHGHLAKWMQWDLYALLTCMSWCAP